MPELKGLSLFSGIGGIDLAFNWTGGNILAFCEIDPFCQKVLRKHWPDVPIFSDIHKLSKETIQNAGITETVDVIYGGFPCQPFSVAGNKKGKDDTRYLWPEFSRLVGEIKPRWVVAENVPGILQLAADDVCRDLEHQGYEVGIWDFEAAAVGAKHRRERIFFVAHSGCTLRQGSVKQTALRNETQKGTTHKPERPDCTLVPDTGCARCKGNITCGLQEKQSAIGLCGRWESEPCVDRVAHGIPNRVDRLRALGNAVVPQQAYPVFKAIMDAEQNGISHPSD